MLAILYAAGTAGIIGFQIALICGAPWGKITQGGRHDGPLDAAGRGIAGVSIILLLIMGAGILSAAGYPPDWPRWTGWVAVAISGVSMILNWITPSSRERKIWGPITTVMFLVALRVMVGQP